MRFLAPVGGKTSAYGILTAPNHKGIPADIKGGKPWAADLGCLEGPDFVKRIDFDKVKSWLEIMAPYRSQCLFIAGGDVVGNASETLQAFPEFSSLFISWPVAYVAQDGAENLSIPPSCKAVFIGGSTEWKVGLGSIEIIGRAQNMGKHVHIGRVNAWRRYSIFRSLSGSDDFTCDGTRVRFDGTDKTIRIWNGYENRSYQLSIWQEFLFD